MPTALQLTAPGCRPQLTYAPLAAAVSCLAVPAWATTATEPLAQPGEIPAGARSHSAVLVETPVGARSRSAVLVETPVGARSHSAVLVETPAGARSRSAVLVETPAGARSRSAVLVETPAGARSRSAVLVECTVRLRRLTNLCVRFINPQSGLKEPALQHAMG